MALQNYVLLTVLLLVEGHAASNSSLSDPCTNVVYNVQSLHQNCCSNTGNSNSGARALQDLQIQLAALQTKLNSAMGTIRTLEAKLGASKAVCPPGYTAAFKSSCYKFFTIKASHSRARLDCQAEGGVLVIIETRTENNHLRNYIMSQAHLRGSDYWIGLTDYAQPGVWTWSGTGRRVTYRGWGSGEPDGATEHCAALFRHKDWLWADIGCTLESGYICEKPMQRQ